MKRGSYGLRYSTEWLAYGNGNRHGRTKKGGWLRGVRLTLGDGGGGGGVGIR